MPSFWVKQSGFTSHSKSEPNGQPRNNESMSIVTCRGDQTYGLCKSGITYVALIVAFLMISDSGSRLESYFMLILLLRSALGHRHPTIYRKIEFSAGGGKQARSQKNDGQSVVAFTLLLLPPAVHLDGSRIENVRSRKQTKSHLLTSSASGLRSQRRAHSVHGTFPFVRIKPEHEASHIAARVTAKVLDPKGSFLHCWPAHYRSSSFC